MEKDDIVFGVVCGSVLILCIAGLVVMYLHLVPILAP